MLRTLVLTAGIALASVPALAQDDRAARLALAEEYLAFAIEDISAEQFAGGPADGVITQLRNLNADLSGDKEARVRALFGEELADIMRGVMREQAGAAAEIYTLEELELLIELYSSPTGRSLLQKNAEFVRGYQPLVVAELRDRMGVLNGRILEIVGNE
ncbi:MAG: hypothetical protein AAFQ51_10460 [Pseudomonadota bacterium]